MTVHVALLRAVNVGGRALAMADLRTMFEALHLADVRTLLQSGNVVFRNAGKTDAALEVQLERETARRLRLSADYLVRTAVEWRSIVAANPFRREAEADPAHLLLMPLKAAPGEAQLAALQAAIKGRESVRANGRELYIVYPDGIGRSKLTGRLIEKMLETRGTARNWNTVLKLQAMLEELTTSEAS